MSTWRTGDTEPAANVTVLIDTKPSKTPYLVRQQEGWLWAAGLRELSVEPKPSRRTPLSWAFATSADDGVPCEVRELTATEHGFWEIS
ncbi:Hypothetical protein AJAP_42910 (plasmid) [Amycolatopsis japonica]|uniref:Uncharacterized protein n=1 Tax=Amycolatopsis japonica TaxID=208439 RepID=A0A075VA02_9PSEU|nr:hypothetical protein [Amycolatopsis japonica]AIG81349.1 Hypothetical protein AJAP_42910 [Amycolatopsis japonica]